MDLARDLPKVSIDVDRINQVIYNLLNNAIRYIEAGCTITVSTLAVTVKGQPYVQVQIADTGSGIAPEDLQHIFQYFYRSEKIAEPQERRQWYRPGPGSAVRPQSWRQDMGGQ